MGRPKTTEDMAVFAMAIWAMAAAITTSLAYNLGVVSTVEIPATEAAILGFVVAVLTIMALAGVLTEG